MGAKLFTHKHEDDDEAEIRHKSTDATPVEGSPVAVADTAAFLMQSAGASETQVAFFEQWLDWVYRPAVAIQRLDVDGEPNFFFSLTTSTDLSALELSVTLPTKDACGYAREFVESYSHHATKEEQGQHSQMVQHMQHVTQSLGCRMTTLWCRVRHMGSSSPALDVGFHVDVAVPWVVADILMPPSADQEMLREHARQQLLTPCGYGCSIFPIEPESYLDFEFRKAACTHRGLPTIVNQGLLFFKALAFAKPDLPIIRAISDLFAMRMVVRCSLGMKGITRLSMISLDPLETDARNLASSLSFPYSETLKGIDYRLGTHLSSVHFAAEERGYTVSIGFKN